ncbi:hypothetical protein AO371_1796 [Moraxella catarrhalis]|nr:hypothetical protein AO371_1796 [Moraxella catarrhalis]
MEVDRPVDEQLLMVRPYVPLIAYLIEKWGYAPVVNGECVDESFMRAKELPIWYANNIIDSGWLWGGQWLRSINMDVINRGLVPGSSVALPVNPYTGDLILTQEAAEALDLSDYDPGIKIVPAEDGEVLIEVRDLIEAMGYVAPKQKYWDKVQSDSDDE